MRQVCLVMLLLSLAACSLSSGQNAAVSPTLATATFTPIARHATVTPTLQPTAAQTTVNTSDCSPRTDWAIYVVVASDTLGSIAQRTGTSVNRLRAANCLADVNLISVGQQLRVSRVIRTTPLPPLPTLIPTAAPTMHQRAFLRR